MKKRLSIKDFNWIVCDKEKKEGYYSLRKNDFEITLDWTISKGWTISVCNKFEEVLEEYGCAEKDEALEMIDKIYKSF